MDSLIKKVQVIGIDNEGIVKDDSFPAAYELPFKLSELPDSRWAEIFEHVYKINIYSSMKRRAYVSGNTIIVILADSDDTQHQADIVKRAVEDTNSEVDRINKQILAEMKREKVEEEKEMQSIKGLKKKQIKLNFNERLFSCYSKDSFAFISCQLTSYVF